MVRTHIIKNQKTERCFCGIWVETSWVSVSAHKVGEYLTEHYIKKLDMEELICKNCLKNWRKSNEESRL